MENQPSPENKKFMKIVQESIPWIVMFVVTLLLLLFFVLPRLFEWNEKKGEIKDYQTNIPSQESLLEQKNKVLKRLKDEFNEKAKEKLIKESQLFPVIINTSKVAKILELYALQLNLLDTRKRDSFFRLESLNFSERRRDEKGFYTFQEATMKFKSDQENLEEFIHFLQTGEISERFLKGKESGIIETADYKFIEENLLPLGHVENLAVTSDKKTKGKLKNVQIRVKFFSQLAR